MTARTETAAAFDPTTALPFSIRGNAHWLAALQTPEGSPARLEQFELAALAWVDATEREPGGWLYHYKAAEMFVSARDASLSAGDDARAQEFTASARKYLEEARRLNPLELGIATLEKSL